MSCRVYLGRLPYGTREDDIRKFFRGFGRLREINLKNGYGFVVGITFLTLNLNKIFEYFMLSPTT